MYGFSGASGLALLSRVMKLALAVRVCLAKLQSAQRIFKSREPRHFSLCDILQPLCSGRDSVQHAMGCKRGFVLPFQGRLPEDSGRQWQSNVGRLNQ
jgi:hypothetical protein